MNVQVLFFGATAEVVGERKIEVDLEGGIDSAFAFKQIVSTYPALRKHTLLFAINQEYADGSETLNTGDELGIFTAVSGG